MDYLCEINFAHTKFGAHRISTFVSREGWLLKGLFKVLRLMHEIENVRFAEAAGDGGRGTKREGWEANVQTDGQTNSTPQLSVSHCFQSH